MRVFESELDAPVGYVLPVTRALEGAPWRSGRWFLRRERCYLIPGDSPIGYRLPLDSLPWVEPADFPHLYPPDPNQSFAPLAPHRELREQADGKSSGNAIAGDARSATARGMEAKPADVVRTSMCAQARDGVLYVFMPPTRSLDDYLEIVAAVESCARSLRQPVVIEGYEPPADPRLANFKVTPDPGVIEVNVQPSASWDELVELTTHLHETAHALRLRSEKFMIDGRHVGTGGGNHIVLGRRDARGFAFLEAPGSAAQLDLLLAQSSLALVPVLGAFHRAHLAGAARRRGPQRFALRARARVQAIPRSRRGGTALDRGPLAAESPDRRHGQHTPRGILHRQAVLARFLDRPARTAGAARLRDAAASAHEPRAAAAAALARGALLARALCTAAAHALGNTAARSLHAAATSSCRISPR